MEQVRCFVAIELPEKLRLELAQLQNQLKATGPAPVKWVAPNGIHVTLKFLGSADVKLIPDIVEAITKASQGIAPFYLEMSGLGLFPGPKQPRVVWVGLKGDVPTLLTLQRRLEERIAPLGFPTEARAFTPHVTLGRVRPEGGTAEKQSFAQRVFQSKFDAATGIDVRIISLMRSQLTPSGAIYSRLAEVRL